MCLWLTGSLVAVLATCFISCREILLLHVRVRSYTAVPATSHETRNARSTLDLRKGMFHTTSVYNRSRPPYVRISRDFLGYVISFVRLFLLTRGAVLLLLYQVHLYTYVKPVGWLVRSSILRSIYVGSRSLRTRYSRQSQPSQPYR